MPESKKVITLLTDYAKRLDSSYQIKVTEYQSKVAAYDNLKDVSEDYKKIKVGELADLEVSLKKSQDNGNKLIQLKRDELMRPLYKKLRGVIEEIAKADGYSQILTTNNEFAYFDPKFDVTNKALTKLGIEIPKEE